MNKIDYDVSVTDVKDGYKVTVKEKNVKTTRNTRVGFSPLRLLSGKGLGLRINAGRKKTESTITDVDTMVLSRDKWETQLDNWSQLEGFNIEIINEIKNEINKIIIVKGY